MGESIGADMQVAFHRRIRLQFHGAELTSDAGLLMTRELDEALGLTELAEATLADTRTGRNIQHDRVALLRQSVYAERLAADPAMCTVVGRRSEKPAASTNTLSRFETQTLSEPDNLEKLAKLNGSWVAQAMKDTGVGVSSWTWTAPRAPCMGSRRN